MSNVEPKGSELERYVAQGQLADRQEKELSLVGFSPDFPARVSELNDALTRLVDGSFQGFRFTLHPDEKHPEVDVEARHFFPFSVVVEAQKSRRASLSVTPRSRYQTGGLGYVRLSQLLDFTDAYPTGREMMLTAKPRHSAKAVSTPLSEITSTSDFESLGITPSNFDLEVGFEDTATMLSIGFSYPIEPRIIEPVFNLTEVSATDSSERIETIIGSVAVLLSKNAFEAND
jgi:hypothetical protein